ncbi:MAG: hypothetical protein N2595_00240 [bacterium]|nr:hypothetical protein [bacterium]
MLETGVDEMPSVRWVGEEEGMESLDDAEGGRRLRDVKLRVGDEERGSSGG